MADLLDEWSERARQLKVHEKVFSEIKSFPGDAKSSASNISKRSHLFLRDLRPEPLRIQYGLIPHLARLGHISEDDIEDMEAFFKSHLAPQDDPSPTNKLAAAASQPQQFATPSRTTTHPRQTPPPAPKKQAVRADPGERGPLAHLRRFLDDMDQSRDAGPTQESLVSEMERLGGFAHVSLLLGNLAAGLHLKDKVKVEATDYSNDFILDKIPLPQIDYSKTQSRATTPDILEDEPFMMEATQCMDNLRLDDSPTRKQSTYQGVSAQAPTTTTRAVN